MDTVHVRIKKEIAAKGCGFYDIDGRQEILPPRDKKGKPNVEKVFELAETPFVRMKIGTGELVVVRRDEKKKSENNPSTNTDKTIELQVNGKTIVEENVPVDFSDEEMEELAVSNKEIIEAVGNREVKKIKVVSGKLVNIVIK